MSQMNDISRLKKLLIAEQKKLARAIVAVHERYNEITGFSDIKTIDASSRVNADTRNVCAEYDNLAGQLACVEAKLYQLEYNPESIFVCDACGVDIRERVLSARPYSKHCTIHAKHNGRNTHRKDNR